MGRSALAKRLPEPESETTAAVVFLCDLSGSMQGQPVKRLREHLAQMWAEVTPFTKLFGFNVTVFEVERPENLPEPHGGTDLHVAFDQIAKYWPAQVILLSDGLPSSPEKALEAAAKLPGTIDAIFVGPESDRRGIEFMRRLTTANGGQTVVRDLHASRAILGPAIREMLALPAPIEL